MNKILISTLLLLTQFAFGQKKQFDEVVKYYNSEKHFNGTVVVATNGNIDYIRAIGLADRSQNTAVTRRTKFKIASITNAFTAVLILQLYEQGKIELNVPFERYYPSYKGNGKDKVTISHLLTYSSGIPDKSGKLQMKTYESSLSLDDYIDKYCSDDIEGNPGEKSIYSNTEYIILTKIIENVTHKSFGVVLEENILRPLKMKNSGIHNYNDEIKGLAKSYSIADSAKIPIIDPDYYVENFFGAGAMYSTVEDLLKFDTGIFKNKLLSKSNTELMIKPNVKLNNVAFGVWYADGYGDFNKPFVYRTGGILGACSNWIRALDDKKSIIVFNNTNGTNLFEMSGQIYLTSRRKISR